MLLNRWKAVTVIMTFYSIISGKLFLGCFKQRRRDASSYIAICGNIPKTSIITAM